MITDAQRDWCLAFGVWFPNLARMLQLDFPTTQKEVNTYLDTFRIECQNKYGYRYSSVRALLCDALVGNNLDVNATYEQIVPKLGIDFGVGQYQTKIEFCRNPSVKGGNRIPKPLFEQREELLKLLFALAEHLRNRRTAWQENTQQSTDEQTTGSEETTGGAIEPPVTPPNSSDDVPPTQEPPSEEIRSNGSRETLHPYLAKVREIRAEETRRSEIEGKRTPILEAVSGIRPAKNGKKMLNQGIPTEALLHALALDWPQEARSRYGIRDYDVTSYSNGKEVPPGRHSAYPYVMDAISARIPIAAIGPSGTGKSTLFQQIARDMNLDYGMIPCNAGVTPSWFVGAYVLDQENPYRSRSAMDMFRDGGILVLEEFDAIDANIALLANNLIENDPFENPVTGEKIPRHPDFIPVACMNTKGTGKTGANTGRNRLDDATRNRFAIGRFELMLDEDLELHIFNSI